MSPQTGRLGSVHIVVGVAPGGGHSGDAEPGGILLSPEVGEPEVVAEKDFAARVRALEAAAPRWGWDDTSPWSPRLLEAGVRVDRCVDLRLSHAILRSSELTNSSALAMAQPG